MIDLPHDTRLSSRTGHLLLVVALLCYLAQATWILAGNPKPGWFTDSVFYLALADFFGTQPHSSMPEYVSEYYATSRYPPLFPLALALAGAGLSNWHSAYVVNALFGLTAIIAVHCWLRQQTKSLFSGAALLPLAILSPQFFFLHLEIVSESQFITLLCATLYLAYRCRDERTSITGLLAIASLVPLSRSVGIALLLALCPWILIKLTHIRLPARMIGVVIIWIPIVAWTLYRRMFPIANEYTADLLSTVKAPIGVPGDTVFGVLSHLLDGFSAWFTIDGGSIGKSVAVGILLLAGIGWARRIRSLDVDATFVTIYIILIAIWPYPAETARLLAVAMPLLALHAYLGAFAIYRRTVGRSSRPMSPVPAGAAILLLSLAGAAAKWVDIVSRATAPLDRELDTAKRTISYFLVPPEKAKTSAEVTERFTELVSAAAQRVGVGECVWTPFVITTGFMAGFKFPVRLPPQDIVSATDASAKLTACRYLIAVQLISPQLGRQPLYPATLLSDSDAKPVMVSRYMEDGHSKVAALLLDLQPASGVSVPEKVPPQSAPSRPDGPPYR